MNNATTIQNEKTATRFDSYGEAVKVAHNAVLPTDTSYQVGKIEMDGGQAPVYYVSLWQHKGWSMEDADQIGFL